ncbi:hypothetical protein [Amycolatopsis sp. H20-H5]|uniref:hypothetical protein n=1 Tax=Amycolatopsis sp. H20-H5 TaxID=3046309 RepID=UPI002DBD9240|nr:hypothetical protein [Amycolatopsis sp. H20-H5]MEC3978616.1 hypothetical protein [Amycolatopsis sp. H20-H5]
MSPTFTELVSAWEAAYRMYMSHWQLVQANGFSSAEDAAVISAAARGVADAWHELAKWRGLPWWCVASLESSVEGFREVSAQWHDKAVASGAGDGR